MANLKEIVTKAVIGKTKKNSKENLSIVLDNPINTVLGCWIINHNFQGNENNGKVEINGNYDVNVWYSYENNTKTNVIVKNFSYVESVNVKVASSSDSGGKREIIVRALTSPQVTEVKADGNIINLVVEKELGVEVVGNMKVRINVLDEVDDYEEESTPADEEINENYLNGVNQN